MTREDRSFWIGIFLIVIFIFLLLADIAHCSPDRCRKWYRDIIRETNYTFGLNAQCSYQVPLHDCFLNQIRAESACKPDVTAFDGGMGLCQFMPGTAEWIHHREKRLKELGYYPYNPQWSIRAMILYNKQQYWSVLCEGWYFTFRAYNGGCGMINKEIKKATTEYGDDCWQKQKGWCCYKPFVEDVCGRKVIRLRGGQFLDMCVVNISYPKKIMKPLVWQD